MKTLLEQVELKEAESTATIIKAKRIMKLSLKTGENSLGVDLKSMKCEFFNFGWMIYIGKPGSIKEGVGYDFENEDKAGFMAYRNGKLGAFNGFKVTKSVHSYDEFLKMLKAIRLPVVIIDPELTKGAKPAEVKKEEPTDREFWGMGAWGNPYRAGDEEVFVCGPYETRAEAKKAVDYRHKNGQPRSFRDWSSGSVKVFDSLEKVNAALKKMKRKEIKAVDADFGNPGLFRPSEI